MIKIPSVSQMRELDALTIEDEGIASADLMERAALAVTDAICRRWPSTVPVVVFAGPGNNGGDALAVARLLACRCFNVEAFLFNTGGKLSPDCQDNRERLKSVGAVHFTEVTASFEPPQLTADKLVVDGLFGTGINKPLAGGFASLVRLINDAPATVVAIDVPSGLMNEAGYEGEAGPVVKARLTFTFQLPKLSMMFPESAGCWGEVHVLDIGLSARRIADLVTADCLLEESDVNQLLLPRSAFGHKGTFGHALLIAGRYGMAGAAILAAKSCLRSGVGKVTVHTPQMNNSILQVAVPEAILSHDASDTVFTSAQQTSPYDAVCIGPGIGTDQATAVALLEQVTRSGCPLLIDADGINILGNHPGWVGQVPRRTILTPHPAELSRLVHRHVEGQAALAAARHLAVDRGLYVVLKGHHTAICTPEGLAYFNTTGNSGMATAGSGDVLSGMITALLAQGYAPLSACMIGVYLHGVAGDLAARDLSEDGLVASDIIARIPWAFRQLRASAGKGLPKEKKQAL